MGDAWPGPSKAHADHGGGRRNGSGETVARGGEQRPRGVTLLMLAVAPIQAGYFSQLADGIVAGQAGGGGGSGNRGPAQLQSREPGGFWDDVRDAFP